MTESTLARLARRSEHPDRKRGRRANTFKPCGLAAPLRGADMVEYWTLAQAVAWTQATEDIITEHDARNALLRAWRNGRLEITGVKEDSDDRVIIPVLPERRASFIDIYRKGWALHQKPTGLTIEQIANLEGAAFDAAVAVFTEGYVPAPDLFWYRLRVRADQCKTCWPALLMPSASGTEISVAVPAPGLATTTATPSDAAPMPPLRKIGREETLVSQAKAALGRLFPDGNATGSYSEMIDRIFAAEGKRFAIDVIRRALGKKT
jgi:hypothetical protein